MMSVEIENAIGKYIESKHRLGEQSGGSGHMAYVSFKLDEYDYDKMEGGNIKVTFKYTLTTETEFTYYPDNPPYKDQYEGVIILDKEHKIRG